MLGAYLETALKQKYTLEFTHPEFNNLTVINRKVVSILSVEVEIPLTQKLANGDLENITFRTSSPEIIHLCIYEHSMRMDAGYGEWEELLFLAIIHDKNLDDIDKANFQSWNLGCISLAFAKWKEVNLSDSKNHIFHQMEKIFDKKHGKKLQELDRYCSIANQKKYLASI